MEASKTMSNDSDLLCFTAMSGVFAGHQDLDQLWSSIVQARTAPLTAMPERWGIARSRLIDPTPGTRNRSYLDRAFCLDLTQGLARRPQRDVSIGVCEALWSNLGQAAPAPRSGTALVWGTSWSDDSLFRADSELALHRPVPPGWLSPDAQLDEVATALGLDGPRLSVDTACSSFPYALATAETLIRSGQARRAVVAGVNVFLPPQLFLGFSQLRALSPDARLKAFAQDANGIVPGEGVAAFLVEPLDEAMRAGRRPLGLLRSLGMSSDGSEGSVFAPGHRAQLSAYQRAYQALDPASIAYVEAHGTGTPVGDQTELRSLDDHFRPHMLAGRRLPVGSVKTLVGHTLAAAGAASLAKVLLMLRHRTIPPHIDVQPQARLHDSCLTLPTQATALNEDGGPLRIGLSSFGFGGANAHLVIEDASAVRPPATVVAVCERPALHGPTKGAAAALAPGAEGVQHLNLDVVDFDASWAIGPHADQWLPALQAQVPPAAQAFPAARAGNADVAGLRGHFLQGELPVDIADWRMGPKPLAHVDPFKLLLTHRTRRLLDRLPGWSGSPDTAVVVCANLGGERFLAGYRSCVAHFEAQAGSPGSAQAAPPEFVVDDVATMLPTMLSGYPAQVLDLRAFHQTVSGPSDSFWQTLLSAPRWLQAHCTRLVLGAGHYLNCPVEAQRAAASPWPWGEGYGVLALRRHRPAQADGAGQADHVAHPARARLQAVVHAHAAVANADAACAAMGWPTGHVVDDVIQLSPADAKDLGPAQQRSGFLAEASGMEAILRVLTMGRKRALIEVRRGGQAIAWLFLDHIRNAAPPAEPPVKLGLPARFSPPLASPAAPRVTPKTPPLTATAPNASAEAHARTHTTALADTLTRALLLRTRILDRLLSAPGAAQAAVAPQLAVQRQDARNVVLRDLRRDGARWQATVRVDEQHPYHFDHPLDHVPGILLLEAALQVAEVVVAHSGQPHRQVLGLRVRFRRYTDKATHIALLASLNGPDVLQVQIAQHGAQVCDIELNLGLPSPRTHRDVPAARTGLPDPRWLHKVRPDNLLVHDLEAREGCTGVVTAALPATHALADCPSSGLSMLYFLEVARQSFMLVAHGRLAVPLGTPMNLIDLRFTLSAPIPRLGRLWLAPQYKAAEWTGQTRTSQVTIRLEDANGPIGQASIVSQAISPEAYKAQRHAEPA